MKIHEINKKNVLPHYGRVITFLFKRTDFHLQNIFQIIYFSLIFSQRDIVRQKNRNLGSEKFPEKRNTFKVVLFLNGMVFVLSLHTQIHKYYLNLRLINYIEDVVVVLFSFKSFLFRPFPLQFWFKRETTIANFKEKIMNV